MPPERPDEEPTPEAAPTSGDAPTPEAAATPEPATPGDAPTPEAPLPDHLRNRPDGPRDHGRSQGRLIVLLLFGLIPMLVVIFVVLNSLSSGPPTPGERGGGATDHLNEVTRYCIYTAKDDAGYRQCLEQTEWRVLEKEKSNAARYARGELDRCLPGSGYRCTLR